MNKIKIPVGSSSFVDIRENKYYYVDKSSLIKELLNTDATKVTLITRPRRFGKTLAMSMLAEFFDIRKKSKELFSGLNIAKDDNLCSSWMNQYPTLFFSFKDVRGNTFDSTYGMLKSVISKLCIEHAYLFESPVVDQMDKEVFLRLKSSKADDTEIKNSIDTLMRMMYVHYGRQVILLLDEYDVPIAKASESRRRRMDYYDRMMEIMSAMISTAIKDNAFLKFAVITGCLRIAKESIFTGTNNFVSDTISDTRLNEYFGFTKEEVERLLFDTKLVHHAEKIRKWYDGYRFGKFDIYCPWDVMNYVNTLLLDPDSSPKNYWENTSDNSVIRFFLDRTDFDVNEKFEILLAGGCIKEPIEEKLTYDVLESSEKNLWTLLYFTGYLTKTKTEENLPQDEFELKIPNAEVMDIFRKSVKKWFTESAAGSDRNRLFSAIWSGDEEKLTEMISDLLFDTISYYDYRESFYHAFIVGLVSNAGFLVESNYENGTGRSDIVIKDRKHRQAAVIEIKWTETENQMEKACKAALEQIEERQYAVKIEHLGYKNICKFGIAFFQKKCLVKKDNPK